MSNTELLLQNILDRLQSLDTRVEDIACKQSAIAVIVDDLKGRACAAKKWWQDINIRYILAAAGLLIMLGKYSAEPQATLETVVKAPTDCTHVNKVSRRPKLDSLLLHKALDFK